MTEMIRAISLWQPWASLWLSPNKRHETRHWGTKHRGPILVHAAKKFIRDVDSDLDDILTSEFGGHWGMDLPTGAIIGLVDLVDCVPTDGLYPEGGLRDLTEDQWADYVCGDFDDRRFGWRRGSYTQFREPIPFKGHQRLFNVPRDLVEEAIASGRTFV